MTLTKKLPNLPITGQNVIIRRLQANDLSDMYTMESDPDVKRYLNGPVRRPREEWIRGMESKLSSCQTLAILARATGQFAGRAALDSCANSHDLSGEVTRELQIVISKDYRGRHFGHDASKILIAAAFDELGAEQVIGIVHPENKNCLKMLRLLGFQQKDDISIPLSPRQRDHLKFALPRSDYQKPTLAQPDL